MFINIKMKVIYLVQLGSAEACGVDARDVRLKIVSL